MVTAVDLAMCGAPPGVPSGKFTGTTGAMPASAKTGPVKSLCGADRR